MRKPRQKSFKALIRKAVKDSPEYKLKQLIEQETRWKRKQIIASNKLITVRKKINAYALELAEKERLKSCH